MRVFVSYRRDDAGGRAGRLRDSLVARLGPGSVFQDVAAIGPGRDFMAEIDSALDSSDVTLAVIGRSWLDAATPDGERRLAQDGDVVRTELVRALERDIPVVPVLVDGAAPPDPQELPDDLRPLALHQAVELRDETWHQDVDGLLRRLRGEGEGAESTAFQRLRLPLVTVALVALAAASLGTWMWLRDDDDGTEGASEEVPTCGELDPVDWDAIALGPDPSGRLVSDDGAVEFEVVAAHSRPVGDDRWDVLLETRVRNATTADADQATWHYEQLIVGGRPFEELACMTADPPVFAPGVISAGHLAYEVSCEPSGRIQLMLMEDQDRIEVTGADLEPVDC